MNKLFNARRFGKLLIKHTTEHYKGYGMALAVLIGVMTLGGSFMIYMINDRLDQTIQNILFVPILLLAGTIFTSTIFADLGEKRRAIAYLTLPATHFEKYLVAWVYSFLLFLVVYSLGFCLVSFLLLGIRQVPGQEVFNLWKLPHLSQVVLLFAFLHSIAFWGAIRFEKLHFIKTAFVFFIFIGLLILLNKGLLSALTGRTVEAAPPFGNLRTADAGYVVEVSLPFTKQEFTENYLMLALTLLFWISAYYRLKEKQV